jgi:ABC-type lipoprotein export system ATPase subunit
MGIHLSKKALKVAAISAMLVAGLSGCGKTQLNMIEVQKTTFKQSGSLLLTN